MEQSFSRVFIFVLISESARPGIFPLSSSGRRIIGISIRWTADFQQRKTSKDG